MRAKTPAPAVRCCPRPDYYQSWTGPSRKRRPYARDVCVVSACLTMVFFAAQALGYL